MSGQGHHSSIQLFSESEGIHTDKYYTDLALMEDTGFDYVKLRVEMTSGKGAVYVVYSEPNFGRSGSGIGKSYVVYTDRSGEMIRPGFSIRSFRHSMSLSHVYVYLSILTTGGTSIVLIAA